VTDRTDKMFTMTFVFLSVLFGKVRFFLDGSGVIILPGYLKQLKVLFIMNFHQYSSPNK